MKPLLHQLETIDTLDKQFAQNNNKTLVILPSGAGKTHTIAFHVARLKPKSFLYVVHQNDILIQTVKIFRDVCGLSNGQIGIINQKNKDYDKQYIFATIQTLRNDKNLEKIRKDIEYMVIDEYHHVAADSYIKIITNHFKPKYLVGLTATPYRLDKLDIMKYIDDNIANEIDLFEGIERKILTPFHYIGLWDNIDYNDIRWSGYRYNIGDLDRKLIIHKRDKAVLEEYKNRIKDRLTIGFCNSVEHVDRITKKFKRAGVKAVALTYKEKPEIREEILYNFRKGDYQVLFTRDILNEGVDFPECSAVMLLRPTISKTIFFQQIGRGLRKKEGKKDVLILDYIGNYNRVFEKRNWLKMFKKVDESTGKNIKPYYEYSPRIKIEFDPRAIKIMDIQERCYKENLPPGARFTTNKQELIDNYYMVKELAKDRKNKFYSFSNKNIPPKSLFADIKTSKYSMHSYHYNYGSFVNFLQEIGEIEITDTTITRWDSIELTKKKLNIMAEKLQKKLNRQFFNTTDWENEYKVNGMSKMKDIYGGFNEFKKQNGYPLELKKNCPICNKETTVFAPNKKNKSYTCSQKCSNLYFNRLEKTRKELEELRNKKLKIIIPCGYCDKPINKYYFDEKNDRLTRMKYCSRLCSHRYHLTDGKKRPLMTLEEKMKKVSQATKNRWQHYREQKKKM